MFSCGCGRSFKTESALAQHQAAKHSARIGSTGRAPAAPKSNKAIKINAIKPPFPHAEKDRWMWKDTRAFDALHVLSQPALNPCVATVSSEAACELICSYSWQDSKEAAIIIPGFAPIWQHVPLPITLPADKGNYFIDQSAARVPRYPFEPVFRAAEAMNPTINFADVDIVINRNSLRKLLDFCGGTVSDSFRINLAMVDNTLFIERHERNARELIRGTQTHGWGHNFEKAFTKLPKELEHSTQYHRVIRYPLGELNCAVRFEVDACYGDDNEGEKIAADSVYGGLALDISKLSIEKDSGGSKITLAQQHRAKKEFKLMPQSTTAEIKTTSKDKSLYKVLPQLWFGRTPWLIMGHHVEGIFDKVNVTNVEANFKSWETRRQNELKKLVSLLSQLRESVKKGGFKRCIATCERQTRPRELKIFPSSRADGALPDDLIIKFWHTTK
ncbi:hypothetical protein O1611_g86 [Lasiodiplodia mahajangana]|uniref:Uncharacterized protein n=1 Tax=Lasiodiplodia mahajangana TaxID=1108764 RepID=A0ACC2K1S5_9PEZI|nr:hypothetical protein O1611_g86 [Lasiodiplodia mahajangana]